MLLSMLVLWRIWRWNAAQGNGELKADAMLLFSDFEGLNFKASRWRKGFRQQKLQLVEVAAKSSCWWRQKVHVGSEQRQWWWFAQILEMINGGNLSYLYLILSGTVDGSFWEWRRESWLWSLVCWGYLAVVSLEGDVHCWCTIQVELFVFFKQLPLELLFGLVLSSWLRWSWILSEFIGFEKRVVAGMLSRMQGRCWLFIWLSYYYPRVRQWWLLYNL